MQFESRLGPLWLDANQTALTAISYTEIAEDPQANQMILQQAQTELESYLKGQLKDFSVPIEVTGGTAFQKSVWQALQQIPYGQTLSYQAVAEKIGRPKAVRAIGQANRANQLPIIIPCHRVIGKNGQLTGYTGSSPAGLKIKAQLLELEKDFDLGSGEENKLN